VTAPEPKWPTPDEVAAAIDRRHGAPQTYCAWSTEKAIEMCRAAWLAANDDPSMSLVGEVRQSPSGLGKTVMATSRAGTVELELGRLRWFVLKGAPEDWTTATYYYDSDVRGWPVIGAVPGTPAAEAQS
jgi:hypothetical protein